MSKIEIAVEWETPVVFAGEEVKCTITFKNTTRPSNSPTSASLAEQIRMPTSARERWKMELPNQTPPASATFPRSSDSRIGEGRQAGHRPTQSINVPVNSHRTTSLGQSNTHQNSEGRQGPGKHKRSVSIISIGQQLSPTEERDSGGKGTIAQHIRNNHARSVSLQSLPIRKTSLPLSPQVPPNPTFEENSTLSRSSTKTSARTTPPANEKEEQNSESGPVVSKSRPESAQFQGVGTIDPSESRRVPASQQTQLKLQKLPPSQAQPAFRPPGVKRNHSQRLSRQIISSNFADSTHQSLQRAASSAGGDGTPRSSMDIYSHSNNSSETLQSEYVAPTNPIRPLMHRRQGSQLGISSNQDHETLMMGYVQLIGSFVLEGSLVNLGPFEAVKRKAVIGGQGSGGVVGIETTRRDSGLFGSLGWGSIGQSLGGLLGSEEPSSIREMKGIANSRSIPIISTAQSILFVDLQLKPGESKRFSYSHLLPHGIPPTFKGRAIKSSYNIVVGTQRPNFSRTQSARSQHSVRQIEAPFKVLPSVDESGEVLGHDLMNPHVILNDMSKTKDLDSGEIDKVRSEHSNFSSSESDAAFKAYVDELLQGTRKDSGAGLLSPTAALPTPAFTRPASNDPQIPKPRIQDLIDSAVAQYSASGQNRAGSSSLQISRGGEKVAKVVLNRTAFRTGETVLGSVDFSDADVACFALNASLESEEVVDPALAVRSNASIHRATRRAHAQVSENTINAERISFALTIPPSATPEFVTSGIRLEWKLRLEFITEDNRPGDHTKQLLEVAEEDERGSFASAAQELPSQSFDVPVTLRIYGVTGTSPETEGTQGYKI